MNPQLSSPSPPARPLPTPLPRKLNVGCGFDIRPGFLNVDLNDFHNPDLVGDITDLPALPSGHFDYILAKDVLEHVGRAKARAALAEWARLLAPNGVLEVQVPSLRHLGLLFSAPEFQTVEKAELLVQMTYGTQSYNGDYHLSGYTERTLQKYLADAGLLVSEASIRDNWLLNMRARKAAALQDHAEYVHNAFITALGRPADEGGLAFWTETLRQGKATREHVLSALKNSGEARLLKERPSYLLPYVEEKKG